MNTGLYPSDQVTAQHPCPVCNTDLPCHAERQVYVEVDILNRQNLPVIMHPGCAAERELDNVYASFYQDLEVRYFVEFISISRDLHPTLYKMVCHHLMVMFEMGEESARMIIRHWSENK